VSKTGEQPADGATEHTARTGPPTAAEAAAAAEAGAAVPRSRWAGLRDLIRRHRLITAALVLAAVPRVVAILGYRPAVLFKLDSFDYLWNAVHLRPDPVNTSGYSLFLWLLRPFHSLTPVVAVQYVLGLSVGLLIYVTLRHWRVREWVAVLAAAPVLFAAPEILAESLIMADFLALGLMVAAFAVLLTRDRPSVARSVTAGLLLGASVVVRPTTLPLILLMGLYLLVRRAGWRRVCAVLVGGAVPVLAYMTWFASATGSFNLTDSNGLFLWSRTMSFANCSIIKPPADLVALCPNRQPGYLNRPVALRPPPKDYLWDHRAWMWLGKPLSVDGVPDIAAFTPANNARAEHFAIKAIKAQPLAYLHVVAQEAEQPFVTNEQFFFPLAQTHIVNLTPGYNRAYALAAVRAYVGSTAGIGPYLGSHLGARLVNPWAHLIHGYQRLFRLPGALFGLILLAGLAGLISPRHRNWPAALLWVSAVVALVVPIAEHDYTYRYVLPVIPLACMAVALCFGIEPPRRPALIGAAAGQTDAAEKDTAPGQGAAADQPGGNGGRRAGAVSSGGHGTPPS
jgi:hypothetical protein